MNIEINRINSGIEQNPQEYIKSVNDIYLWHIKEIVENIARNKEQKPVILLSGPSGSGKTTTALIIAKMLSEMSCPTHTLSMDNYFKSLTDKERELSLLGKLDLESPDRIDKDLLNTQIEAIEKCQAVDIPRYNFAESKRDGIKMNFQRNDGELVIFEGIHALNPDVITFDEDKLCKLYVSVRTRIIFDDIILHPSKVRLMRRMIRDRNFRKRSLRETMNMFHSVELGENKYIMPYKHRSDYDIDTFMAYEMNVYRDSLLDELKTMNDVPELADVTKVLENLDSLDKKYITPDSLICEFIGGGIFKY